MNFPPAMLVLLCLAAPGTAAVTALGPTKYLQASDSPWFRGIQNGSIYLEDFTDGLLNTPFVTGAGKIRGPGDRRSVDGDDGTLDGNGENGGTWGTSPGGSNFGTFEFNFAPNDAGLLPLFVDLTVTQGVALTLNMEKMGVWVQGAQDPQFVIPAHRTAFHSSCRAEEPRGVVGFPWSTMQVRRMGRAISPFTPSFELTAAPPRARDWSLAVFHESNAGSYSSERITAVRPDERA